ncbi:hypothetical protein QPK87_01395 [Kamptonema cortianum]|nr:hypothetical protein [Kamptonema cortianum]
MDWLAAIYGLLLGVGAGAVSFIGLAYIVSIMCRPSDNPPTPLPTSILMAVVILLKLPLVIGFAVLAWRLNDPGPGCFAGGGGLGILRPDPEGTPALSS